MGYVGMPLALQFCREGQRVLGFDTDTAKTKALNAGQYPLSVLAMTPAAEAFMTPGVYGNTMTAAPRAMDVGTAVLESITPKMRANIQERGKEFVAMLKQLATERQVSVLFTTTQALTYVANLGDIVQVTGFMEYTYGDFAIRPYADQRGVALDPERFLSCGTNSTEEYLRTKGFGVIHGGKNALRYTPHFAVTTAELELIVEAIRDAIANGPRK